MDRAKRLLLVGLWLAVMIITVVRDLIRRRRDEKPKQ